MAERQFEDGEQVDKADQPGRWLRDTTICGVAHMPEFSTR
jgi:hypothetical protein